VRRIRKSVESDLELKDNFFKLDDTWTSKSKLVIQREVVRTILSKLLGRVFGS